MCQSQFIFPLLSAYPNLDWEEKCAPVDFTAAAVVYIARLPESTRDGGTNYHLIHEIPFKWSDMFLWVAEWAQSLGETDAGSSLGTLRPFPFEEWMEKMQALTPDDRNALSPLLPLLTALGQESHMPKFNCSQTLTALRNSPVRCPAMDRVLLRKFLCSNKEWFCEP